MILKSTAFFDKRLKRIIEGDPEFIIYEQMKRALELPNEFITAFAINPGSYKFSKRYPGKNNHYLIIEHGSESYKKMKEVFKSSARMETLYSYIPDRTDVIVKIRFYNQGSKEFHAGVNLRVKMDGTVKVDGIQY